MTGTVPARVPHRRFPRLHRVPASTLVVLLLVSVGVVLATRALVSNQDSRLLKERATEVSLVLGTAISADEATLAGLGHVARDGGAGLFTKEAADAVTSGPGDVAFALLRPAPLGPAPLGPARGTGSSVPRPAAFVVVAEAGDELSVGQRISGPAASAMRSALQRGGLVSTPVIGSGQDRSLGFALGGPTVPTGTVVYRDSALGLLKAPRQAGTAPFDELDVVLYDASRPDPGQLVVATTRELPLSGPVLYLPFAVGTSRWTLAVSSPQPLVGMVAAWSPWAAAGVGAVGSVLVAAVLEQVLRRRDAAVDLYRSEHLVAEALQNQLLPSLSHLPGLDIASRYVAASDGQQVGGDWFDLFDLGSGRTGVVIGDVMGHDVEAAAAMAQVRASLRAYAWEGGGPASVLERLARLVDAFSVTGFVTVVYGVLEPPDERNARWFRWANAGHLPPFVRFPDGRPQELRGGRSGVIGAPGDEHREEGELLVPAGSLLVLYTDGLVERPGVALTECIERLRASLQHPDGATSADDVCDFILQTRPADQTRDDIALVVVRPIPPA